MILNHIRSACILTIAAVVIATIANAYRHRDKFPKINRPPAESYDYARGSRVERVLAAAWGDVAPVAHAEPVQPAYDRERYICEVAELHKLPCNVMLAIMHQETGGNHYLVSSAGAIGLMQIMPFNAKLCGLKSQNELWDERKNIDCAGVILSRFYKQYNKNLYKAIAGYNGGNNCQERCRKDGKAVVCISPCKETHDYVRAVIGNMKS